MPADNWVWKKELFVPFVAVAPFDELDEAIEQANDTEYGLTAGFFSEDQAEIDRVADRDRGRRRLREPPGRARRPARGRACSRSAAGRAPGTTGKAGGGPYYVSSTCASSPGR